jgi:hypothetical protein
LPVDNGQLPRSRRLNPLGTLFTSANARPAKRAEMIKQERRLVWRVLSRWKELELRGRIPQRDEVDRFLQGEDGPNCLLIAVGWSIERSHIVVIGVNLAAALCPTDTLASELMSRVPQVVSSRRGLIIDGSATLRGVGIVYRAVLLPLSEDGNTIDHIFGATNYRSLRSHEASTIQASSRTHLL